MSSDWTCVGEHDSLLDAAQQLARLDVGAMPICGEDNRLKGMITDRDIVVKALARGLDPAKTEVGQLAQGDGETITIGALTHSIKRRCGPCPSTRSGGSP